MSDLAYFAWLTGQAASGLVFVWPVSLLAAGLGVLGGISMYRLRPLRRSAWQSVISGVGAPFIVLGIGALLRADTAAPSATGGHLAFALCLAFLLLQAACIVRASGQRKAVATIAVASVVPLFAAFIVAGMAMTRDWL